jgi:hypothetical protein
MNIFLWAISARQCSRKKSTSLVDFFVTLSCKPGSVTLVQAIEPYLWTRCFQWDVGYVCKGQRLAQWTIPFEDNRGNNTVNSCAYCCTQSSEIQIEMGKNLLKKIESFVIRELRHALTCQLIEFDDM